MCFVIGRLLFVWFVDVRFIDFASLLFVGLLFWVWFVYLVFCLVAVLVGLFVLLLSCVGLHSLVLGCFGLIVD